MQQLVDSSKELRDKLIIEIENMRMLMVNMSWEIHEEKINIYINGAKRQSSNKRHMTKKDCRIKSSGELQ